MNHSEALLVCQAHATDDISRTIPIGRAKSARRLLAPINDPTRLADVHLASRRDREGNSLLVMWNGWYFEYRDGLWFKTDKTSVRNSLSRSINSEFENWRELEATTAILNGEAGPASPRLTRALTEDVLHNVGFKIPNVQGESPPLWLESRPGDPPADMLLPVRNTIVRLDTIGDTVESTPRLFAVNGLNFDYQPEAGEPAEWLRFLETLWGDDPESVRELQKWFGYCLTNRLHLDKILCIVGPTRSGKGTIANALSMVVGADNDRDEAAIDFASLGSSFGLEKLVGKRLAIMYDNRSTAAANPLAVERLLAMSCFEPVDVNRKGAEAITVRLNAKLMILSNSVPEIPDTGGAMAQRLLFLLTPKSFKDREDTELRNKIAKEKPALLNWALEGLRMLIRDGRFCRPASAEALRESYREESDPVTLFVETCCDKCEGLEIPKRELYEAFKQFCGEAGQPAKKDAQFGRDLLSGGHAKLLPQRRMPGGGRSRFYSGIRLKTDC